MNLQPECYGYMLRSGLHGFLTTACKNNTGCDDNKLIKIGYMCLD